mmetsp:Transcript_53080/g.124351  ORF Transcript_53080/g.124351 Transcript_53080/m.124351 type:complete len:294 (+) Transcript_53080:73-954(+)
MPRTPPAEAESPELEALHPPPDEDPESTQKGHEQNSIVKQTRRLVQSRVVQALLAAIIATIIVLWVGSSRQAARSKDVEHLRKLNAGDLALASPNDLWAVHDLLLVGSAAVFMKEGSDGKKLVQDAPYELAKLLPAIHPISHCRSQFAKVLGSSPGKVAEARPSQENLVQLANTAMKCLPGKFVPSDFTSFFDEAALTDADLAYEARMPELKNPQRLGVCAASKWPRTCSYWVAMHAMAYRADLLDLSQQMVSSLVPILAGGATMCGGCTLHFRALTEPLLQKSLRDDLGDSY